MNRRNRRLFVDGLARLGLELPDARVEALVRYCDEISLWNRRMNLIKGSERDLVVRHLLDSLAPLPILRTLIATADRPAAAKRVKIADVGSGAGVPGIPIAVAMPEASVTLVERSTRKASFLDTVRLLLELPNVTVVTDADETDGDAFDLAVCRAFLPFERAAPILSRLIAPEGAIGFYAAPPPPPVPIPGLKRTDYAIEVPFLNATRTLVVLTRLPPHAPPPEPRRAAGAG